jgi:hypothetical protein
VGGIGDGSTVCVCVCVAGVVVWFCGSCVGSLFPPKQTPLFSLFSPFCHLLFLSTVRVGSHTYDRSLEKKLGQVHTPFRSAIYDVDRARGTFSLCVEDSCSGVASARGCVVLCTEWCEDSVCVLSLCGLREDEMMHEYC